MDVVAVVVLACDDSVAVDENFVGVGGGAVCGPPPGGGCVGACGHAAGVPFGHVAVVGDEDDGAADAGGAFEQLRQETDVPDTPFFVHGAVGCQRVVDGVEHGADDGRAGGVFDEVADAVVDAGGDVVLVQQDDLVVASCRGSQPCREVLLLHVLSATGDGAGQQAGPGGGGDGGQRRQRSAQSIVGGKEFVPGSGVGGHDRLHQVVGCGGGASVENQEQHRPDSARRVVRGLVRRGGVLHGQQRFDDAGEDFLDHQCRGLGGRSCAVLCDGGGECSVECDAASADEGRQLGRGVTETAVGLAPPCGVEAGVHPAQFVAVEGEPCRKRAVVGAGVGGEPLDESDAGVDGVRVAGADGGVVRVDGVLCGDEVCRGVARPAAGSRPVPDRVELLVQCIGEGVVSSVESGGQHGGGDEQVRGRQVVDDDRLRGGGDVLAFVVEAGECASGGFRPCLELCHLEAPEAGEHLEFSFGLGPQHFVAAGCGDENFAGQAEGHQASGAVGAQMPHGCAGVGAEVFGQ